MTDTIIIKGLGAGSQSLILQGLGQEAEVAPIIREPVRAGGAGWIAFRQKFARKQRVLTRIRRPILAYTIVRTRIIRSLAGEIKTKLAIAYPLKLEIPTRTHLLWQLKAGTQTFTKLKHPLMIKISPKSKILRVLKHETTTRTAIDYTLVDLTNLMKILEKEGY